MTKNRVRIAYTFPGVGNATYLTYCSLSRHGAVYRSEHNVSGKYCTMKVEAGGVTHANAEVRKFLFVRLHVALHGIRSPRLLGLAQWEDTAVLASRLTAQRDSFLRNEVSAYGPGCCDECISATNKCCNSIFTCCKDFSGGCSAMTMACPPFGCSCSKYMEGCTQCCCAPCPCCKTKTTAISIAGMSSNAWAAGDWRVHLERIVEEYSTETIRGVPLPSNLSMHQDGMTAEQLTKKKLTKLHTIVIRYVKTDALPAVHIASATLVIHPSEPVVRIMKFVSLLNSSVDGVRVRHVARPANWVRSDADDDASRKLSMGMPALWSGFGSKKKKPAATDDVDDDAEEAPAMDMER